MAFLPISRSWRLFVFGFAACLLCIDISGRLSVHLITIPFLSIYVLCTLVMAFPHRRRKAIQFLLCLILFIICLTDIYCLEYFGNQITPQMVNMVVQTDGREMSDFITTYINISIFLRWRIIVLLLLFAISLLSFFYPPHMEYGKRMSKAYRLIFGLCVFFLFLLEAPGQVRFFKLLFSSETIQEIEGMTFQNYDKGAATPMHRLALSLSVTFHTGSLLQEIRYTTLGAEIDSCSYESPHIVLVIGETYNKHHSQLYGYPLETTPHQVQRCDAGELFVFKDVVTPWNITSNVFTSAFSMWHYGDTESIGHYPLFPILFKRAGYHIRFFSNQYIQDGLRRVGTNLSGGFFLGDELLSDSLFNYRNENPSTFDMGLVRQFREYVDSVGNVPYTLDILHLIGQHFNYKNRYPQSAEYFQVTDYENRHLSHSQLGLIAAYDNATRYNDLVIDSILTHFEHEQAIVIYMADHGEEVFDDLPIRGRLFQEPSKRQARQEFEVPFWIWCSPSYWSSHKKIVEEISMSVNKPFMTDDLSQLLLYLAGIHSSWTHYTNCPISKEYDSSRSRWIYGKIDYDKLIAF